MIQRYSDGLKNASSRAKEIMQASSEAEKPALFIEFINGIKVAAGSAHQLAHTQVDHATRWLDLRDLLEQIIEVGQILPLLGSDQNGHWLNIKQAIEGMIVNGEKLATSKAFSRGVILRELDARKLKLSESLAGYEELPYAT